MSLCPLCQSFICFYQCPMSLWALQTPLSYKALCTLIMRIPLNQVHWWIKSQSSKIILFAQHFLILTSLYALVKVIRFDRLWQKNKHVCAKAVAMVVWLFLVIMQEGEAILKPKTCVCVLCM